MASTPDEDATPGLSTTRALAQSSHRFARWPTRGEEANRLEPECWPGLFPTYRLEAGSSVFAIGSCFARNIEQALRALGFHIPTADFMAAHPRYLSEVINKYTPAAIHDELAWTRKVMDRDDKVRMEDVEPAWLPMPNGKIVDLTMRGGVKVPMTPEDALAVRSQFYSLFRQAFMSDAVIITLGLVECWWDTATRSYVDFDVNFLKHPERFRLVVMEYPEALDLVQRSLDLIRRDRPTPVLITTSPIAIARTFTDEDVIVANTHAKSVLRAVAGYVARTNEGVDYFPSYESVMLTRRPEIWDNDLHHVEPSFIGRIMGRVTEAYVDGARAGADFDGALRFAGLWKIGDRAAAIAAYDALDLTRTPDQLAEFLACAAELEAERGDAAAVARLATAATSGATGHHDTAMRIGGALARVGDLAGAERMRERAFRDPSRDHNALRTWLIQLEQAGRAADWDWVATRAMREHADEPLVQLALGVRFDKADRFAESEACYRRAMASEHHLAEASFGLFNVLSRQKRRPEAVAILEDLQRTHPDDAGLRRLARAYMRAGRPAEAAALLQRLLRAHPGDKAIREMSNVVAQGSVDPLPKRSRKPK